MVLTSGETSIKNRFSNFLVWLWGLIYLFFSTIFTDHKKLGHNNINNHRGGGNMKGLGGSKRGPAMGGGWGPKFRRWRASIDKQSIAFPIYINVYLPNSYTCQTRFKIHKKRSSGPRVVWQLSPYERSSDEALNYLYLQFDECENLSICLKWKWSRAQRKAFWKQALCLSDSYALSDCR